MLQKHNVPASLRNNLMVTPLHFKFKLIVMLYPADRYNYDILFKLCIKIYQ